MGLVSRAVKSWRGSRSLRELQRKIAGEGDARADALNACLDLCVADEGVAMVMRNHGLFRADLERIYAQLVALGLGRWIRATMRRAVAGFSCRRPRT
jgi:hypothetical protein